MSDITFEVGPVAGDDVTFDVGAVSGDDVSFDIPVPGTTDLTGVAMLDEANEFTAAQSIDVTIPVTPIADIGTTKPTILVHLHGQGGAVDHFALTLDIGGGVIFKTAGTLSAVIGTDGEPTDEWVAMSIGPTGPAILSVTSSDPGELPFIGDILTSTPKPLVVGTPTDNAHAATKAYVDAGGGGGVALGETSTTAYRGDRGKTAYDHSQVTTGNPHGTTVSDLGAAPTSRTITAGTGLTGGGTLAADRTISVDPAVLARIPTTVTVASDVNSTTDASFTNTTGLSFATVAGTTYYISGLLDVTGINAADCKITATCPAGTIRVAVGGKNYASTATAADGSYAGEITSSGEAVTNLAVITGRSTCIPFSGYFACTADGTFQIQHAQRTANATVTVAKAGSFLTYHT